MKKSYLFILFFLLIIIMYSSLLLLTPETAIRITREDHFVENASAFFWFFASLVFIYDYYKSDSEKGPFVFNGKRNLFYLALALFCFLCMGEEISWGQRIFGLNTPEKLVNINAQKEFNIHNLNVFQTTSDKNGIAALLTSTRLFFLSWLVYCVLVPFANKYITKIRGLFAKLQLPVIPEWLGLLFLLNYLVSKLFENIGYLKLNSSPVAESKENMFAFLFFIAGLSFYFLNKNSLLKSGPNNG